MFAPDDVADMRELKAKIPWSRRSNGLTSVNGFVWWSHVVQRSGIDVEQLRNLAIEMGVEAASLSFSGMTPVPGFRLGNSMIRAEDAELLLERVRSARLERKSHVAREKEAKETQEQIEDHLLAALMFLAVDGIEDRANIQRGDIKSCVVRVSDIADRFVGDAARLHTTALRIGLANPVWVVVSGTRRIVGYVVSRELLEGVCQRRCGSAR